MGPVRWADVGNSRGDSASMKPPLFWRSVVGFPEYEVSNTGIVRRVAPSTAPGHHRPVSRLLKMNMLAGYAYVLLCGVDGTRRRRGVHSLVAEAFIGPRPEGHQVNHKDFARANNHADNLEYLSPLDNNRYSWRAGRYKAPPSQARLSSAQVMELRRLASTGVSYRVLAERFGIKSTGNVCHIVKRHTYADVGDSQ